MKRFISILFLILWASSFATAQTVSNVNFEKSGKQIIITYDLSGANESIWDITVYCSRDGSQTLGTPLKKISGDCGVAIRPGLNKKITWDVLAEIEKLEGEISFTVEAKSYTELINNSMKVLAPPINKKESNLNYSVDYYKYKRNKTVWLVSAIVAGGVGTFSYLQTSNYYNQYQTATTDASGLHAKAELYNKISPVAFAIAGFCTLEFILQASKQSKSKEQKLSLSPQPLFQGAGIAMVCRF